MELATIGILSLLVFVLAVLIYFYVTERPSYKCSHEWEERHHSTSAYFDYYIYTCKKCGRIKKVRI